MEEKLQALLKQHAEAQHAKIYTEKLKDPYSLEDPAVQPAFYRPYLIGQTLEERVVLEKNFQVQDKAHQAEGLPR